MTARFELNGLHEPVVVLHPEDRDEAILLAAFIRYDSNVFHVSIDRYEDGRINELTLRSEQS